MKPRTAGLVVEPLDVGAARATGEALATLRARVSSARAIDAAVAAHAATTGAVIVTSDVDDFEPLEVFFRRLKVRAV
jgi:predicted nucleic acid-binding protein